MVQDANFEADFVFPCRTDLDFHNIEIERKTEKLTG